MGFFESFSQGIRNRLDKREEERLWMEQLQKEDEIHRRMIFEEEFKKNRKEVVEAKAKQDAARMSGLQKLRATNRARNLTSSPQAPGTFFEKLSSYTHKNIAEREKNLAKTEEMRKVAKEEREKQLAERQTNRMTPVQPALLRDRKSSWRK